MNEGTTAAAPAPVDTRGRDTVIAGVGAKAPDATGPISATIVNGARGALAQTVKALTGGEVDAPVGAAAADALPRLTPELYTALVGFQGMIDAAVAKGVVEASDYKIDARKAASDPDALAEAVQIIASAGRDKGLSAAMRRKVASEKPAEAPKAPKEPAPAPKAPADELAELILSRGKP